MKKSIILFVALAMWTASCSKEENNPDRGGQIVDNQDVPEQGQPDDESGQDGQQPREFALIGVSGEIEGTRTELSENQILWKSGDAISVWEKDNEDNANVRFSLIAASAGQATGKFSGTLVPASEDFKIFSIYPYDSGYGDDPTDVSLSLPTEVNQTTDINEIIGVGDFMLGKTTPQDYDESASAYKMRFWHPLAFIKFHIDGTNSVLADAALKSMTMTADVAFVGDVSVDCINGTVTSAAVGDAGKTLVINFPNTAVMSSVQDAWVAINPVDLTDADCHFVLETTNGQKITFSVNPGSLQASHRYKFEFSDLDTKVTQGKGTATYVDLVGLAGGERANCYIIRSGGYYRFAAQKVDKTNCFDGSAPSTDGYKAYWLWSTGATSIIDKVGIGNSGNINFRVNAGASGNASIVLLDPDGVIVWSWHIWCTPDDPMTPTHYFRNDAWPLARRNLGATSDTPGDAGTYGLYYQWGRKDPVPYPYNSGVVFNTAVKIDGHGVSFNAVRCDNAAVSPDAIGYTISHPSTFLNSATYYTWISTPDQAADAQSLWSNVWGTKSNYDPCPPGYYVPINSNAWTNSFTTDYVTFTSGKGAYYSNGAMTAFYPAAGMYNALTDMREIGTQARCWTANLTATPAANAHIFARTMVCTSTNLSNAEGARSNFGQNVRCMKR